MASSSSYNREKSVYTAKLAHEAGRYEDMANEMVSVVRTLVELTAEERNLIATAFKKMVESRRASLKKLRAKTDIFSDVVCMLRMTRFQENVKEELEDTCRDILNIIDNRLIPSCHPRDYTASVFYLKMKGDYCRYVAETTDPDWIDAAEASLEAYETATIIAKTHLPPTHPIRLGLALNYSVYYYKIEGLPKRAAKIANKAFNEAISGLDGLKKEAYKDIKEAYKDIAKIMKLLRDNITYWESEITGDVATLKEGGIASI